MKKGNQWLVAIVTLVIVGISCKKDQLRSQPANENASLFNDYSNKVVFAKTLAKAIAENPQVRTFIKEESLKQFDNDDDVLFQFVKDKKINGQATFYEILMQYADQKEAFALAINNSPLLTIFVPTLPNLSPEEWDANTQIPQIAVEPNVDINSGKISIYDAAGNENRISPELIPGFPVLVIKTNERVVLNNQQDKSTLPFFSNDQFSFKFLDKVFDGLSSSPDINTRTDLYRPANPINSIDKVNVDAFKSGSEWHRDYVYYGITPTNPTGKYTNRYSEFVRSFKVIKPQDLVLLNDHTNDPKPDKLRKSSDPMWTEGLFEFRMSALINARNGVGQEYKRYFSARGQDLFNLTYVEVGVIGNIYRLESITSREFNPKLEITSWDLEQYGSAWKFSINEYDPSETITKTTTHTSTYSGNFEFNLGEIFKIGPKFGASSTSTHTTTYQIQTTTGSDDLAEGILDFRSPVITSLTDLSPITQRYHTYEVTTGILSFSVEPKALY